jgi:hypothetical protein
MQEQILLQENGVTVSQARFVVPGQTFAMQGVSSVSHNVVQPSRKWPIILVALGVLVLLISFSILPDIGGIVMLLIGLAAAVLGVVWFRGLKPDHLVVLNASTTTSTSRTVGAIMGTGLGVGGAVTSTSGQNFVTALSSKDGEFVTRVVAALNNALVARG